VKTLALLVVASRALPALAGDHPPVALEIEGCETASEIRRIVALELGAPLADAAAGSTRAYVTCNAGDTAILRVDDPAKPLAWSLDLAPAIPKARARLVALAIVELISTSWTERDPAAPPVVRAQPAAASSLRLVAHGGGSAFSGGTGLLGGGGIRLEQDRALLGWLVDLEAHHGRAGVSLGDVTADVLDVAAALAIHHAWSRARLALAAGLRGGGARLAGSADAMTVHADHFWAPWLGALALASASVTIVPRWSLELAVEGGGVIVPVGGLVNDRREVAIDGAWLTIQLGVGVIL